MPKPTEFFKEICKYSREDFDKLLIEKGKHGKLPKVFFHLTEDEKDGEFHIEAINKNEIISKLEASLATCTKENVVKDTIQALKEYLNVTD